MIVGIIFIALPAAIIGRKFQEIYVGEQTLHNTWKKDLEFCQTQAMLQSFPEMVTFGQQRIKQLRGFAGLSNRMLLSLDAALDDITDLQNEFRCLCSAMDVLAQRGQRKTIFKKQKSLKD